MVATRRIVLCVPDGEATRDPNPAETAKRHVELAGWEGSPAGVVGFGEGGWRALEFAAENPDLVDRLVLVSTPILEHESVGKVTAKTLLLYGSKDQAGGHAQASWWLSRLGARIEMVPGEGHDILERVWPRVLSFLAPHSLRK